MGPRTLFRKVVRRLQGMVRWEQRLNAWEAARFDKRRGIDTAGGLEPTELTVTAGDPSQGITYFGTQTRLLRWWLTAVPSDHERFTFIDMGSGKGRVPVFAAEHGFRRAIGVEFAQELHDAAADNARILRKRGIAIEPVLGDAGAFEFPEEPLVVYFNNPFHESVMERVLAKLASSYSTRPRPVVVVYQQMTVETPEHDTGNLALLDRVGFLEARTLDPPRGVIDRRILAPFTVRFYESSEVKRSS
ncbi:MAG: class I SAM-dependent methyltransferase [Actinomycetota bacterium]|nr:class I SAM-dependent methyltransferase [Actinomycetota bacterium]